MVDSSCYAPYNQWQEPHLQDVHDRVVTAQSPERHRDCRDQDAEDSEDHPGDDCDGEVRVGGVAVAPARMEGVEEGARVGDRQEPDQIQTAWIVSDYKSQRMSIVRVKKSGSRSLDLVDSGGLIGSIRELKGQLQWPLAKRRADRKKKTPTCFSALGVAGSSSGRIMHHNTCQRLSQRSSHYRVGLEGR